MITSSASARLLRYARRLAAEDGDKNPTEVVAVLTTHGRAARFESVHVGFPSEPVYFIAMRGNFHCRTCANGGAARSGPVITAEFTTAFVSHGYSIDEAYPDVASLGTPVSL